MKKRLIVCSDGTWNRPEKDHTKDVPTNVLKMARAIKPAGSDGIPQQVFYDWGIGSYHDKVSGGSTGKGLDKNIMDGYRYIVQNYSPGDEIFLFGFSRGAYTIRSLCGMINNCGILKRPDAKLIELAFTYYKRSSHPYAPKGEQSAKFRSQYSHRSRKIHFVGVWDTVGAMGIPLSFLGFLDDKDEFYDTEIGSNVSTARHALAIDELRTDFVPTIWKPKPGVDIRQVWFCGAHSDVGGGYPRDPNGASLSDIPLDWLIRQAQESGLVFESHLRQNIDGSSKSKIHKSRRKYYRLKKRLYREIHHGNGDTLIHRSGKERWERDSAYRKEAKNLATYLEKHDWPSALES